MFLMNSATNFNSWLLALWSIALSACASQPSAQFSHFPTAAELSTPESRYSAYQQARIDFQRAAAGHRPLYARWSNAIRDGGTTFYHGSGYDLTVWNRFSVANGVTLFYSGPEIQFDRPLSPRGPASYSIAATRKHP